MWIQERQRNNRHDLYSTTASRKMPGTECGPLHDLCRPYQKGRDAECTYSSEIGTVKTDRHVTRMPDKRLPKKILYGELQAGKRSHGGQKKRYKDILKASLKDFNIPIESWEQIAQDETKWQGLIRIRSKKNQRSRAETCTAESQS